MRPRSVPLVVVGMLVGLSAFFTLVLLFQAVVGPGTDPLPPAPVARHEEDSPPAARSDLRDSNAEDDADTGAPTRIRGPEAVPEVRDPDPEATLVAPREATAREPATPPEEPNIWDEFLPRAAPAARAPAPSATKRGTSPPTTSSTTSTTSTTTSSTTTTTTGPVNRNLLPKNPWGDAFGAQAALWTAADTQALVKREGRSSPVCWEHYDFGLLDTWQSHAKPFCSSGGAPANAPASLRGATAGGGPGPAEFASQLTCRSFTDDHLPRPTAPHTVCDARDIVVNFEAAGASRCPRHRPHYNCDGDAYYWNYQRGFLSGVCDRDRVFHLDRFPRDFLRDIFDAWDAHAGGPTAAMRSAPVAPWEVTLFVTRERREHANLFHASTDFMNAFFALHLAGVINGHAIGDRAALSRVAVVLLDEQPAGPFDSIWEHVFAPSAGVFRASDFRGRKRDLVPAMRLSHAVFAAPGYTHFLFAHLFSAGDCREGTELLRSFREFVLSGMGVPTPRRSPEAGIRVLFISRKPYNKFVEHKFVGRQVDNEPAVVQAMKAVPGVESVELVDFVHHSLDDQLAFITGTDILVGMHGAALTFAVYLPPWAAVLELWPKEHEMWMCFEHLSELSGVGYERWANRDNSAFRKDEYGDYTRVHIPDFERQFRRLVDRVHTKRRDLLQ